MPVHVTETNPPHPGWSSEDAANLRKFLKTTSGQKLLGMLAALRPGFQAVTMEGRAIEASVVDGWERCAGLLLQAGLLKPSSTELNQTVAYPDLDADAGWEPSLVKSQEQEPEMVTSLDVLNTES